MSWREELRAASFRDVPFHVDTATTRQGLHADEQVFLGRDDPGSAVHVEHLGSGPRRYQIDAYVVGDDVFERRAALEAALREPGPGRLVHPYRGELVVSVVGEITTTETRKRGGYARVTFAVVETTTARLARVPDTAAVIERDLDAFLDELAGDYAEQLDTGVPDAFEDTTRSALDEAWDSLGDAYAAVGAGVGEVVDFARDVNAFAADVAAVFTEPFAAARAIVQACTTITSLPLRLATTALSLEQQAGSVADAVLGAMRPLITFGELFVPLPEPTANRRREAENRRATVAMIRGAALGATVRALARLRFGGRTQALAAREELLAAWDRLVDEGTASGTTDSGTRLHEAIAAARRATIEHLSEVARTLPEVVAFEVREEIPALVLAHELYGDARLEAELLDRNSVPWPALIPAGTVLEVRRG